MSKVSAKPTPRKSISQDVYVKLIHEFQTPHRLSQIARKVFERAEKSSLSESSAYKLRSKILESGVREVKLKWPHTTPKTRLYSSAKSEEVNFLELAMALTEGGYLCYQSALFWNELTEQVPKAYYLAKERPPTSATSAAPESWDDLALRDAFTKLPAEHKNIAHFGDYRLILLDRAATGRLGVVQIKAPFNKKRVQISITGLERTLLDCASMPENAGGLSAVIAAFEAARDRLDIKTLIAQYQKLGFKYPHWQRIGFILRHFSSPEHARQWQRAFGEPKNKFYLAKGYRLDWPYDEQFRVYYPPGII